MSGFTELRKCQILLGMSRNTQGEPGPQGATGPQGPSFSKVAVVDPENGNDMTASVGGIPFATLNAALASTGQVIYLCPGIYTLSAGITIPANVTIRGFARNSVLIRTTSPVTLITMGEGSALEDLSVSMNVTTGTEITAIKFPGITSQSSFVQNVSILINNLISVSETADVTGIEFSGSGSALTFASVPFENVINCFIEIKSNGSGDKRGILVSNSNQVAVRDSKVFVAQPVNTASTGSFVGVETTNEIGSIQIRSSSIGVVVPTQGQSYTASDILQTAPTTITNPTYLASSGIQIGPGTDLVTKSAGGKGFSTFVYPTIIYYGLKGNIKTATNGVNAYCWPGTQLISSGSFPDTGLPAAFFRVQQPSLISGLSCALNVAPGTGNSLFVTVCVTPVGGIISNTAFTITLSGSQTEGNIYGVSHRCAAGDRIHLLLTYSGNNDNLSHDFTAQIDLF